LDLIKKINYFKNNLSYIDLHLHSSNSDGSDTPEELVRKSIFNNMKLISINDHDNILKKDEYEKIAFECTFLKIINGIETSASLIYDNIKFSVHILGYKIIDYGKALNLVNDLKNFRKRRNLKILNKMKEYFFNNNINYNFDEIENNWDFYKVSRIHFAQVVVDAKIEKNLKKAFKKYFTRGNIFYFEKEGFTFEETLFKLKECFSKVFIAHPFISLPEILLKDKKNLKFFLDKLIEKGIDGIEAFYPEYKRHEEKFLLDYCCQRRIPFSCGSDYHGKFKPYVEIGKISKNLNENYLMEIFDYFNKI